MPKRIMIADDALELGRLLQTVLMTYDSSLSVQVVPSAEEALLESSRKPLDLLVADIRLPGMSGFDLVRKIRTRHPEVRVIFITGWSDPALEERAKELQVDGFFRKPLDMTAFVETARRCLGMTAPSEAIPPRPRKRTGSLAGKLPAAEVQSVDTLSDVVASLRQRLAAEAVVILDEAGRLLAQAGNLPSLPLDKEWAAPIMAALGAGDRVARLAGNGPGGQVMAFSGPQHHVLLAPVAGFALLVFSRRGRSALRLALAVEEILEVQRELADLLARMGARPAAAEPPPASAGLPPTHPLPPVESPAAPPPPPENTPGLADFEALLSQPAAGLKGKDADAFWENLPAGDQTPPASPDALTYEQARKLGLAPDESK